MARRHRYGPWQALKVDDQFRVGPGTGYSIAARLRKVRAAASKWNSLLPGRKFHVYRCLASSSCGGCNERPAAPGPCPAVN